MVQAKKKGSHCSASFCAVPSECSRLPPSSWPGARNSAKLPLAFRVDQRHPGHFDPIRKAKAAAQDVYTPGVTPYPWAEDAYFMFPTPYYHYGPWQREFREGAPVNAGVIDVRFASSRDGIAWDTYDWRPFVPLGMEGEFDSRRR